MNKKIIGGIVLIILIGLAVAPVSSASTVTVHLDKKTNSGNVTYATDSYIVFEKNTSSSNKNRANMTFNYLRSMFQNVSFKQSLVLNSSHDANRYKEMRDIIARNSSANITNINVSVEMKYVNVSSNEFILYYNSTLHFNITHIFHGNQANMSWRGFNMKKNMSETGSSSYQNSYTSHFNNMNYSVFEKSLSTWHRSYNSSANNTMFSYDAGDTMNTYMNNTGFGINIHYVSDPSYTIIVPGHAYTNGNDIILGNQPGVVNNSLYIVAGVAAVVIVSLAGIAITRRKNKN